MNSTAQRKTETTMVAAALTIGTLSGAVPLLLPGLVGILRQGSVFDDSHVGYLASAALAGVTLGSALGARLVYRVGTSLGVRLGMLIAAAANMAATVSSGFWSLLGTLLVAGFGAGIAFAVCWAGRNMSTGISAYFLFVSHFLQRRASRECQHSQVSWARTAYLHCWRFYLWPCSCSQLICRLYMTNRLQQFKGDARDQPPG